MITFDRCNGRVSERASEQKGLERGLVRHVSEHGEGLPAYRTLFHERGGLSAVGADGSNVSL